MQSTLYFANFGHKQSRVSYKLPDSLLSFSLLLGAFDFNDSPAIIAATGGADMMRKPGAVTGRTGAEGGHSPLIDMAASLATACFGVFSLG